MFSRAFVSLRAAKCRVVDGRGFEIERDGGLDGSVFLIRENGLFFFPHKEKARGAETTVTLVEDHR